MNMPDLKSDQTAFARSPTLRPYRAMRKQSLCDIRYLVKERERTGRIN